VPDGSVVEAFDTILAKVLQALLEQFQTTEQAIPILLMFNSLLFTALLQCLH
jgi:hypothetical protein